MASPKKLARIKDLYERKLVRPEGTGKVLPLNRILQRPISFFPAEAGNVDFDLVEIGPGKGEFLLSLAAQFPDKKIVGLEIGAKRFNTLKTKLIHQNITNVSLIFGDARIPFHKHFKDESIEKCFVLFPDPWPRNRHRHMRLLQKEFLMVICSKLKKGGEFTLATDVQEYATWVCDNLSLIPGMNNVFGKGQIVSELPDLIPTHFKMKWTALGRSSWCLRFRKV